MQMVLTRELQANSRRPQTYHRRLISAGCAVGVLFLYVMAGLRRPDGASVFYAILTIAFIVCSFEAINRSCSSITAEKEEGTLGLLLLTRLTGHELLAGKFLGAVIASLQPVLALLPALAIPIFMGGITGRDLAAASIALIHTVIVWLAAGLTASATAKTTFEAAMLSVGFVSILASFLAIFSQIGGLFLALNPMTPILLLFSASGIEPWHIATSLLVTAAIFVIVLRSIGKNLPNEWRAETAHEATLSYAAAPPPSPKPVAVVSRQASATVPRSDETSSPRWFEGNPISWLVLRETGMHNTAAGRIAFSAILGISAVLLNAAVGFFLSWVLILILALAAPLCAARARRSAALELWLTAPLSEDEIRSGYYKGLREIFFWPAVIIFGATLVSTAVEIFADYHEAGSFVPVIFGYQLAIMLLACSVVPRFGLYMGLKSASPLAASLKTAFIGVLLPWLLLPIPNFIYYPILGVISQSNTLKLRERVSRLNPS